MLQKLEFLGRKDDKILSFESVKYTAHRKMSLSPFQGKFLISSLEYLDNRYFFHRLVVILSSPKEADRMYE